MKMNENQNNDPKQTQPRANRSEFNDIFNSQNDTTQSNLNNIENNENVSVNSRSQTADWSFSNSDFDRTIATVRTNCEVDMDWIPMGRNTNIFAETATTSTLSCGNSVEELLQNYNALIFSKNEFNDKHLSLKKIIGKGNQGVVFYGERLGTDNFHLPIALKFFTPDGFCTEDEYRHIMSYNAKVASAMASIQHDNLMGVRNWFMLNEIRIMEMEWVDGYDLFQLMQKSTLEWMEKNLERDDFEYKTKVIITPGPVRPRLKSGIALAIIRDCLLALEALHQAGIVHGDIKPANIMLKRTGRAKIIDLGAATFYGEKSPIKLCTPFYAAPEIIHGKKVEKPMPQSDIASLGYVLLELLTGRSPFENVNESNGQHYLSADELWRQKNNLIDRLPNLLPEDVLRNKKLVRFCARMIHPDPKQRFQKALDAVIGSGGVGELNRELVKYNLSSEYDCDIQDWITSLHLPPQKHPNNND